MLSALGSISMGLGDSLAWCSPSAGLCGPFVSIFIGWSRSTRPSMRCRRMDVSLTRLSASSCVASEQPSGGSPVGMSAPFGGAASVGEDCDGREGDTDVPGSSPCTHAVELGIGVWSGYSGLRRLAGGNGCSGVSAGGADDWVGRGASRKEGDGDGVPDRGWGEGGAPAGADWLGDD